MMEIEVWSDLVCPFCYIGKRHLEAALAEFPGGAEARVRWKSFLLNPDAKTEPGKSLTQALSEAKGISLEQARQMQDYVTRMAREAGLQYDFDRTVPASSFDAHRLLQVAKETGRDDALEEELFRSYFCEGGNIADRKLLEELGARAGLEAPQIQDALEKESYADAVRRDYGEAHRLRVQGVPFFLMNRRFAVSGAQPKEVFLRALAKAQEAAASP